MTAREILVAARDLYASAPSHCAAGGLPEKGTYCGITALSAAQNAEPWQEVAETGHDAWVALKDAVQHYGYTNVVDLVAEQSTEIVIAAFDRAIRGVSA